MTHDRPVIDSISISVKEGAMCDLVRARWWTGRSAAVIAAALVTTLLGPGAAMAQIPANAKLPDLMTMIPQQLQIVNPAKDSKREVLRFSNGIANIGEGPWRMRPELPTLDPSQPQMAIQELLEQYGQQRGHRVRGGGERRSGEGAKSRETAGIGAS
jgi:hypothetical protein